MPIYISKENFENQINLLLITEGENRHYVLIKDFNEFTYNQTKHKERKYFCMYCLRCFSSEDILTKHRRIRITINGEQAIKMSEKGEKVYFKNYHKQQRVSFVIYADFEAITKKVQGNRPNNDKLYTEAYQTHEDRGYGYKVVCCYDDEYTKPTQEAYRGKNAVFKFMEEMLEEVNYCKKVMKINFNRQLKMTNGDEQHFKQTDKCHICNKNYSIRMFV